MKKTIISLALTSMVSISAFGLPSASDMRKITNNATEKAYNSLLSSEKGKKAYQGIMNILENNISRIANGGFYDTFTIHYMNEKKLVM